MSAASSASLNDAILLFSLLFSCFDILSAWHSYSACSRPIHHWLLLSYGCVIATRIAHLLGFVFAKREPRQNAQQEAPEFLLDWRQKGFVPRALAIFIWTLALPFFACLTMVGTSWLYRVYSETPYCVPSSTQLYFSGLWLVLCYIWTLAHMVLGVCAWLLERRLRTAEGALHELEDQDLLSRWGQVSNLQNYSSLPLIGDAALSRGLTPAQIKSLPGTAEVYEKRPEQDEVECPICIGTIESGDAVRHLGCGHTFHRSCVDLWLVRCADCPLCKKKVEVA